MNNFSISELEELLNEALSNYGTPLADIIAEEFSVEVNREGHVVIHTGLYSDGETVFESFIDSDDENK